MIEKVGSTFDPTFRCLNVHCALDSGVSSQVFESSAACEIHYRRLEIDFLVDLPPEFFYHCLYRWKLQMILLENRLRATQMPEEKLPTSLHCLCYCFLVEYLALAGLMNFLAQLSDRIHHFTVYNLMPLALVML